MSRSRGVPRFTTARLRPALGPAVTLTLIPVTVVAVTVAVLATSATATSTTATSATATSTTASTIANTSPTPLDRSVPPTATPTVTASAGAGVGTNANAGTAAVALPGGRPRFVVSMIGGSFNAYWVRLAQYTFQPGTRLTGTVHQSYWMWHQAHFQGNARRNKVRTGYRTAGCSATCDIRTPRGFQPGAGAMATVVGRYQFDRYRRLVITWPGRQTEVWTVRTSGGRLARLALHHTTLGGLYGDGLGSKASFAVGATRDQVAATHLTGVQRVASYGDSGRRPVQTSRWSTNILAPMQKCRGSRSACLLYTGRLWRSALAVPAGLGRRAFWQHQKQGIDGQSGSCFGSGGGHTVALLQALDDSGRFVGFVGAEASFNGRSWHNAVVAQLVLT